VRALDLAAQYAALRPEIDAAVTRVLASGRYVGGPEIDGLESEFAAVCGVTHAVAVSSGTDALRFALTAVGVGETGKRGSGSPRAAGDGPDEVITSPLTFIATTEAITQAGGRTVFVDVDPESLTIDPARLERAITPCTRAIVPIHLYGQTADMGPIREIAGARGVAIIEDACQAHGALYRGRPAGSLGEAGCFSFYPTKNLGACGEGGMLTTSRAEIAMRVRRLRDHGQSEKYLHDSEGYNGRLDALQAAILRVKLKRLAGWNARRRALAARYTERLREMGLAGATLRLPVEKPWGTHVYHLYSVRIASGTGARGAPGRDGSARDRVRAALLESGIETGVHYPVPLHLQTCYAWMGLGEGSFPEAERAARDVLSLPLYPEMTDDQVDRVCDALRGALDRV
jgi:dTDP-4-amino-4,6-dideoxygalactose transaminase